MKIAIQPRKDSFSDRWIAYCEKNNIEYKTVNAYANDIIEQVSDCDAFMWHFHHGYYSDMQFAKALILSLETKGIRCFPDCRTCWHFDNKVWEKYLLEAIEAPIVSSYVFYTEKEAREWAANTTFPKVFKLKGGAGASNVKLAQTKKEAVKLILLLQLAILISTGMINNALLMLFMLGIVYYSFFRLERKNEHTLIS